MTVDAILRCYKVSTVNASKRFILRVTGLLSDRQQTQKSLRGDKTEGWISNIVKLRRALKLDDAETIADALETPLSELVRRPEDVTYELSGAEARLLDAYRQLAPAEQQSLLTLATLRTRRVGRPSKHSATKRLHPHIEVALNTNTPTASASSSPGVTNDGSRSLPPVPAAIQEILARADREIANYRASVDGAREQAPTARPSVAGGSRDRRTHGGSHPRKAQ
ncbi:MAG TPA: hypothetical protein VK504_03975 [Vicinamibacterales bacterium]|nr:hypothetical protein [Vicinamibacterales bacterium]